MATQLVIASNEAAFLKKNADLFLKVCLEAVEANGRASVALSGGSSPKKIFTLFTEPYYKERMPWAKTFFFWGDERCVPSDHADSNYKMAMDFLLKKVPVPAVNIYRMAGEMSEPREAAKSYEQTLKLFFKLDRPFPKFDLVLLGLGEDGHTASLFPGTTALVENERWVVSNYVEKLNSHRITLTYPVINNARNVVFMCGGETKALILKEIFRTDMAQDRYPSQRVNPVNGTLYWLMDNASSSKLHDSITSVAQHV